MKEENRSYYTVQIYPIQLNPNLSSLYMDCYWFQEGPCSTYTLQCGQIITYTLLALIQCIVHLQSGLWILANFCVGKINSEAFL